MNLDILNIPSSLTSMQKMSLMRVYSIAEQMSKIDFTNINVNEFLEHINDIRSEIKSVLDYDIMMATID